MIRHEARGGLAEGLRERLEQRRAVEERRLKELEAEIAAGMYGPGIDQRNLPSPENGGPERGTKDCADYAAKVGRDMWLAGIQECLKLAKEHLRGSDGGEINGWEDLERSVERL